MKLLTQKIQRKKRTSSLLLMAFTAALYFAQVAAADTAINPNTGGYYFYEQDDLTPAQRLLMRPKPLSASQQKLLKSKQERCANALEWTVDCGFIDPKGNFDFEQKQMHKLIQNQSMNPNNPNAVYQWQRFNMWAVNQATQAAYMSAYNRLQHPDINPAITMPTSQFGNLLMKSLNESGEKEMFKKLAQSSILIFFTRHGDKGTPQYCPVCKAMAPIMLMVQHDTGIKTYEASLDDKHFDVFKYFEDSTKKVVAFDDKTKQTIYQSKAMIMARLLHVKIVPTVFLFLKASPETGKGATMVRVSIGAEAANTIKTRILNFAHAIQKAFTEQAKKGLQQKGVISPDFSDTEPDFWATHNTATGGV
ncbi:MAG: conjugal transfer protein TraF [Proteobacteria bacterium]|nr:conjugal transfer protein TraF [Pseudomonadota bacterium]